MEKKTNTELFKEVMGNYPTGVTVVTMMTEEGVPLGMTVNSFASVSLDPLLILWSIDKGVTAYDAFVNTDKFAVHVLSGEQGDTCSLFASKGADRFGSSDWMTSELGLPVLKGVSGVLQCRMFKTVDAGDHTILIGEVVEITSENTAPLLYHRRRFGAIPEEFYRL